MDSDEELKLINEVDELESKLKQAGQHINPKLSDYFYKSLENKSTAERIPKWMTRINNLRERLENHSGSSAVSPVVAHHDQRQKDRKRKADSSSEPEIQLHEAKVADGMKKKKIHNDVYKESDDGSPPIMCPSHVHFIRMSVDELKKEKDQCPLVKDLLETWNTSKRHEHGGRKLTKSLFNNNYITLGLLRRISSGSLPLPVPYDALPPGRIKSEDDGACAQNAGNGVVRKRGRGRPSIRAGESDR